MEIIYHPLFEKRLIDIIIRYDNINSIKILQNGIFLK